MFVIVIDGCFDGVVNYADVIGYFTSEEKAIEYLLLKDFTLKKFSNDYVKVDDMITEEAIIKELELIK